MNDVEDLENYIGRILPVFNFDEEEIANEDSFPILNYVRGYKGDLTMILELMARGDSIDVYKESGSNPLHEALYNPHCDMKLVKALIEKEQGLVLQKCAKMQRTPLHIAMTFECDPEIVEEFINSGADLNAKDCNNDTPLHIAANNNHKLHYILLRHGADPKLKNADSRTPLISALLTCSHQFNTEFIKSLLSVDCDLYAEDSKGNSALYYAMTNKFGDLNIVQLLLEHEVDPCFLKISTCCSINSDIIELFLQYAILTKYCRNKYPTNKIVDKICPKCKFCSTHDNKKKWYLYKSFCCEEIVKMKWDKISEDYSLYEFVSEHFNTPKSKWKEFIPDAVLCRYYSNTYPSCRQLIFISMKKECLIKKLHNTKISTVNTETDNEVVLNDQCIKYLISYFDKEDLINLILAFSDISFNSRIMR